MSSRSRTTTTGTSPTRVAANEPGSDTSPVCPTYCHERRKMRSRSSWRTAGSVYQLQGSVFTSTALTRANASDAAEAALLGAAACDRSRAPTFRREPARGASPASPQPVSLRIRRPSARRRSTACAHGARRAAGRDFVALLPECREHLLRGRKVVDLQQRSCSSACSREAGRIANRWAPPAARSSSRRKQGSPRCSEDANIAWWDSQVEATEDNAAKRERAELAWSNALADREQFAAVESARETRRERRRRPAPRPPLRRDSATSGAGPAERADRRARDVDRPALLAPSRRGRRPRGGGHRDQEDPPPERRPAGAPRGVGGVEDRRRRRGRRRARGRAPAQRGGAVAGPSGLVRAVPRDRRARRAEAGGHACRGRPGDRRAVRALEGGARRAAGGALRVRGGRPQAMAPRRPVLPGGPAGRRSRSRSVPRGSGHRRPCPQDDRGRRPRGGRASSRGATSTPATARTSTRSASTSTVGATSACSRTSCRPTSPRTRCSTSSGTASTTSASGTTCRGSSARRTSSRPRRRRSCSARWPGGATGSSTSSG